MNNTATMERDYDPELDGELIPVEQEERDYDPELDGELIPAEDAPDPDTITVSVDGPEVIQKYEDGVPVGAYQDTPDAVKAAEAADPVNSIDPKSINTSMWDGMSQEEADARYKDLGGDPNSKTPLVIKGKIVPPPVPTLLGGIARGVEAATGAEIPEWLRPDEVDVDPITKASGFIGNAGQNILETGAAVADMATEAVTGTNPNLSEKVEGTIPELTPDGAIDGIRNASAGLAVGGLGAKVVGSIPILRSMPTVKRLAQFLAFETSNAAAQDENTDTLAIGDKSILPFEEAFPILKGVDVTKGDSRAEEILRKRANILLDGAAAGAAAETALKGGAWAGKFLWNNTFGPWMGVVSKSTQEEALYRDISNELAGVDETTPPEAVAAIRDRITGLIRDNKDVVVKLGTEGVDDVAFQRDTMSALEAALESGDDEATRALIARARGIRAGGLNKGYDKLAAKVDNANVATDRLTGQMEEAFGASKGSIDQSAEGLRRSGDEEYQDVLRAGKEADDLIASRESDVASLFPDEARARDSSGKVDMDPYAMKDGAVERIKDQTIKSFDEMDRVKNDKFNAIPEGTQFDLGSFGNALKETKAALDDFDQAGSQALGNSLMRVIDRAYTPKVIGLDGAGEPVVETAEEVIDRISRSGVDFKRLYNDVRPELTKFADDLFKQGKGQAGERVRALINNIDEDQLDFIATNGDDAASQAASEAMRYYREEYAPLWRDGALGDAAQIRKSTTRGDQVLKPVDLDQQMSDLIGGSLSNGQRARAQQFAKLLSSPEGGGSAKDIVDYALGDAAANLSAKMAGGAKLTDIDVSDIYNSLMPYMSILKDLPEAKSIQTFMDTLKSTKGDVNRLKGYADELKTAAETAKERIYGRELNAFFKEQGVRQPNGYKSFADILNNPQSSDVLEGLVERANAFGNPVIMDGMKAAYSRYMRTKLIGTSESTAGVRQVGTRFPTEATEGLNQSLTYGRILFKDNPALIDGLESVMEQAGMLARSRSAKPIQGSATSFNQSAKDSVDRLVTTMLGTLSRTGARIRSATKTVLETLSPDRAATKIMDQMLADPDYFLAVADRVGKSDRALDKDSRDMLYAFMVRAGVYGEDQDDRTVFDKAIDGMIEVEGVVRTLSRQTEDAFGLR